MYKTIRHGETSLQYTILPQHDDFRLEGKFTSNDHKGGSASGAVSTRKPKRSLVTYFGLMFICTVIIGAILIPFLVSTEYFSNPSKWFSKRKFFFNGNTLTVTTSNMSGNANNITDTSEFNSTQNTPITMTSKMDESRKITEKTSETKKIPETLQQMPENHSNSIFLLERKDSTVVTESTGQKNATMKFFQKLFNMNPRLHATTPTNRIDITNSPIILPVLAKTNLVVKENGKLVNARSTSTPQNWIQSHWPFIDPSNYFHWSAYKFQDVLLPALLGAALIGSALLITLYLIVRNKKRMSESIKIKKRHGHDSKESTEDNTTLLADPHNSDDE